MRNQIIQFPGQKVTAVFPINHSDLELAISDLELKDGYSVIVLIGGEIDDKEADATRRVIRTISTIAEDMNALVICGGTDMGIMAEIGQVRWENKYKFPLVGIAPQDLVTWPGGLSSAKFLWWGKKRWPLESHHSHFILVPGNEFGDESPWIVDSATLLSKNHRSVTILINGGEVSRKDIDLSLKIGRPVIAVSRTGRLADEISRQVNRDPLISVVPANADQRIVEVVEAALSVHEGNGPVQPLEKALHITAV